MSIVKVTIEDMPFFEKQKGINLLKENIEKSFTVTKCMVTKDNWFIEIENENDEEIRNFVKECLKKQKWSHNIQFKLFDKDVYSFDELKNLKEKEIYYAPRPMEEIEIVKSFPVFNREFEKNSLYNEIPNDKLKEEFFNQLDEGFLIEVDVDIKEMPAELIKFFLWKEHKVLFVNNKAVVFSSKNINENNFKRGMNAKLFDCYLMWKRDLKKNYREKFYKEEVMFCKGVDFIKQIKAISAKILILNNLKVDINQLNELIDVYKLDMFSEIVMEYPELCGIIEGTRDVYLNQTSILSKVVYTAECVLLMNKLNEKSLIPTGSLDPFGLKRKLNNIINLKLDFVDLIEKGEMLNWITSRINKNFNQQIKNLNCSLQKKMILHNMNWSYDEKKLQRIKNLTKKSTECNEEINEEIPNHIIESIKIENIDESLTQMIDFIEKNKIIPYKNRMNFIKTFLNILNSLLN
jgi:hypothetical protein